MSKFSTYFREVSPTYIENWAPGLYDLSIPQVGIPLDSEEVKRLGRCIHDYQHWFPTKTDGSILRIQQAIERALATFQNGAFIRLGSRSAKDSFYAACRGLKITRAQDAINMLTGSSQRVAFDLRLALQMEYQPYIFVREWVEIPPWTEFRCFVKARQLVGISQYDHKNLDHCPEIAINEVRIRAAISEFFEQFNSVSHLDDVIFDVFLDKSRSRIDDLFVVRLLEINPFFTKTDACLFSWSKANDFDGSFRFL